MGMDYVGIANTGRKEYLRPSPETSHTTVFDVARDWMLTAGAIYLMTAPHRADAPRGPMSELLRGLWRGGELIWVSDYDAIFDANPNWYSEWRDLTPEVFVMTLEYGHSEAWAVVEALRVDPQATIRLGQVVDATGSELVEAELVKAFGKGWRTWYSHAVAARWTSRWGALARGWPDVTRAARGD